MIGLWITTLITSISLAMGGFGEANLTQKEAQQRASAVRDTQYELFVDITDRKEFRGDLTLRFALKKKNPGLFLDFSEGQVDTLVVNGVQVHKPQVKGRIPLPNNLLREEKNEVVISYRSPYSKNGSGLYQFNDPEDQKTYLYTDFEPFDANRLFPCFDQPDIKASLKLRVRAPKDWEVISTTRESAKNPNQDSTTWVFPETPRLSTYLFSLHAGPYKMWTSQAEDIPLRLFARQSMAKHIQPEFWFEITKAGFRFFPEYFDYPYPFKKYDQVIVPDFNSGAMENVAAVTFAERFVWRSEPTLEMKERLANVILHEMAHMWFGNLVTMKWWDDLWLNESFASYMASLALAEATQFNRAWISFFMGMKTWAYQTDQMVTTHPINGEVVDTQAALMVFDGITYGKGASVLKQLAHYLGHAEFKKGLQVYFKKFQYQNTTLEDFLRSLSEAAQKPLNTWSRTWLEKSGVDEVRVNWTCSEDKLTDLKAILRSKDNRSHRLTIGLFKKTSAGIDVMRKIEAQLPISGSLKIPEDLGCPDLIFANTDDHAYIKVVLDDRSLAVAKADLSIVNDPLTRLGLWQTLHEMVRHQQLSAVEYWKILQTHLPPETDLKVLEYAVPTLAYSQLWRRDLAPEQSLRKDWSQWREDFLWSRLQSEAKGTDGQKFYFDRWVRAVENPKGLENLLSILQGKTQIPGLELDPDRRWAVLGTLVTWNHGPWKELLEKEKLRDASERGIQAVTEIETFPAVESLKAEAINEILNTRPGALTTARKRARIRGLFVGDQVPLKESMGGRFFDALRTRSKDLDPSYAPQFVRFAAPAICTLQSVSRLGEFLKKSGEPLAPHIKKPLREVHQEDERCHKTKVLAIKTLGLEPK